ncbi:MAG: pyridoxal phosphate-dependent aminotransferase [Candidatus Aminicenantes bacterium]|nr:pyridoxal phosphate-dependent aminotransferase [Candidatus Aminicenantes bacterium]
MISDKANRIGASPTFKVAAKAKAMKAEGIDVVDLSIGEPDFPTPETVKAAGIKAIQDNYTKYTENDGSPALKKAIIGRLKEDYGLTYAPNEVIVNCGAKSSLFHAFQSLINDDEEVIIPAPYWVSYPHLVHLAKGKSVFVPTKEENGFILTAEELKAHITPATKALLLNSPSNPTGAAYTAEQLDALAEVIRGEDIYVISDEIYSCLVYDGFKYRSIASLGEDLRKKTVLINGVSKAYAMTGWRIGYAAGPAPLIAAMSRIQSHTTSHPASISQRASIEALAGSQADVSRMRAEFERRRNYSLMKLRTIPGLSCFEPPGAFYLFPNIRSFFDLEFNGTPIRNSYGMAYYLLREARVAVVPGDAFGADDYMRLSYATSMENLEKGLNRIAQALARLKPAKRAKRVALSNVVTRQRGPVPVEDRLAVALRDGLVAEAEARLASDVVFEWNANIAGVIVRLRTNVRHIYEMWTENWTPAPPDSGLEPHGHLYAVDGIAGREPRAFFNTETKTGVVVNVDAYAPVRSLALGLAGDVAGRRFGANLVRGMSVDTEGLGLLLVGPAGTKKTELFFSLLRDPRFRFHSGDIVLVRPAGTAAQAEAFERKAFLPTNTVELFGRLAPLFDRSKCENVVIRKEDCQNVECLRTEDCRLDRGGPFCYKAAKDACALLDPEWLGPSAAPRRTALRWIFLLRNDSVSQAVEEVSLDEALRILERGETPGLKKSAAARPQPFFNPFFLESTDDRVELEKDFYRRLLPNVRTFLFNSGTAGIDQIKEAIGL